MAEKPSGSPLVDTLAKNELAIAKLYRTFADKLPRHARFWKGMAAAEDGHASILDALEKQVVTGSERFSARSFGVREVKRSLRAVLNEIDHTVKHGTTHRVALGKALGIEHSLVEQEFFGVVTSDSPEVVKLKKRMLKSIRQHSKAIEKRLEALRPGTEDE